MTIAVVWRNWSIGDRVVATFVPWSCSDGKGGVIDSKNEFCREYQSSVVICIVGVWLFEAEVTLNGSKLDNIDVLRSPDESAKFWCVDHQFEWSFTWFRREYARWHWEKIAFRFIFNHGEQSFVFRWEMIIRWQDHCWRCARIWSIISLLNSIEELILHGWMKTKLNEWRIGHRWTIFSIGKKIVGPKCLLSAEQLDLTIIRCWFEWPCCWRILMFSHHSSWPIDLIGRSSCPNKALINEGSHWRR